MQPLQEDLCYKVSAWVNFANLGCGANQFGILLSEDVPNPLGLFPQIAWAGGILGDSVNWTNVLGYLIADGTEQYITLGNFRTDAQTQIDPNCNGPYAYYYIDDVLVEEIPEEQVSVDLGPDVAVCDSFTIVAGDDPDIVYIWSTGQQGPEITVYQTGTYSVVANFACTMEVDEIEVTILQPIQVNIGPDAVLICEGENYEISLDPNAGEYEWEDGSNDADYTINTAGIYSVTLDDGCHLSSDTIEVSSMNLPLPFTLGNDTILCDGEMITINLDPSLGEFEWHDGSDDPSYSINADGTYSLTVSNMCGEQTDELEVEVIDPPMVFLGPDAVLCPNQIIDISLDVEMGEYFWHDGSTESTYTITEDGFYSVTVTNMCGVDTDEILVEEVDAPDADLGPDIQGCPGDVFTLDPGFNDGDYTWQDGSTSATYTVSTPGIYSLTITNACGDDMDLVNVTYAPAITPPDLGPDISMCPGDEVVLSVASSAGNILWNDMSTADTLLVNSGGTYYVQVSSACEMYSDTVVITLNNNPPVVQLPADFNLCEGDTTTLDAEIAGVTYLWNDGTMTPQLTVSAPGTYSVTVSNSCGTSVDSVLISAGEAAPVVMLGPDTSLCAGESIVIIPTFLNVNTWIWSDGSMTPEYTASSPGPVSIEVVNSCSTATDTLLVSPLPDTPPLDLGPDVEMCTGESVTLSINVPGVTIVWSDGSTNSDLVVTDSAIVIATVSNVCGQNADTVVVDLFPETPILDLGQDQTICPGEVVIYDPGMPGVSYLWHDGSTNSTYETNHGELIYLTITDICGTSTDTVELTESTVGPQVDLGQDVAACQGESITIDAGISGVQYVWQDGSTMNELVVTQSGVYSLTVSNSCGTDMDTVEVIFTEWPPVQALGPDTTLCEGLTVTLMAITSPQAMIQWQDMSVGATYIVSLPGKYYVTASNQCGEESDTILIQFLDAPDPFILGPDTTICPGETVLLSSPSSFYDILWQDGSGMLHLVADHAGIYWLRLSNECGAEDDTLEIDVDAENPILNLESELLWCPGEQFVLDATQSFNATYLWSTGALTPSITVETPGLYRVEVSSVCSRVEDESEVVPEEDCEEEVDGSPKFYIPNIFSPNDDGINDVFQVATDLSENVLTMEGKIFERWGNLVFSSTGNSFTWDGYFNGTMLNPAVFVYVIKIRFNTDAGEREEVFYGDVTLLR